MYHKIFYLCFFGDKLSCITTKYFTPRNSCDFLSTLVILYNLQTGLSNCLFLLSCHLHILKTLLVPKLIPAICTSLFTSLHSNFSSFTTVLISFPFRISSIQFFNVPFNPPMYSSFHTNLCGTLSYASSFIYLFIYLFIFWSDGWADCIYMQSAHPSVCMCVSVCLF